MATGRRCCAVCIGDRHLTSQVFLPQLEQTGKCAYCGSEDQVLLDPVELQEHFGPLVRMYQRSDSDGANQLDQWLHTDWAMFDHPNMDSAHRKELLADILDDGEIVRETFIPSPKYAPKALERWERCRQELKHENRFFLSEDIRRDIEAHLWLLVPTASEIPSRWYRARIQREDGPYPPGKMKAPPREKASHGRANPAGIPYLYLASCRETAIQELRPRVGERATVAEIEIAPNLEIIDLYTPRKTVSPFQVEGEDEVGQLYSVIGLLVQLGAELTRPVLPASAAYEYAPTQYLCELIKNVGYAGVRYSSSVGDGINLALFNEEHAEVVTVSEHRITRITVEHESV